jgi:hypothetical protein
MDSLQDFKSTMVLVCDHIATVSWDTDVEVPFVEPGNWKAKQIIDELYIKNDFKRRLSQCDWILSSGWKRLLVDSVFLLNL